MLYYITLYYFFPLLLYYHTYLISTYYFEKFHLRLHEVVEVAFFPIMFNQNKQSNLFEVFSLVFAVFWAFLRAAFAVLALLIFNITWEH